MNTHSNIIPSALIVDDNLYNREIFRIILRAAGYRTVEASDGVGALKLLDQQTFDLLILDLQMPLMDGRSVLRNLRLNPAHTKMNVIVATANPHMLMGDVEHLADYIVFKPFEIGEFSTLIRRLKGTSRSAAAQNVV